MRTQCYLKNMKGRDRLEDRGLYGNSARGCGLESSGSGQWPLTGCCEHGHETFINLMSV
jgi:hypothetical protein